jgi:epoxyqueuosine reductase QueG
MLLESEIREKLCQLGADFVHFVDISGLPEEQNKGFSRAILLGIALSPESENNLYATGSYDLKTKTSVLPHKTIGAMAGLGWIGKHSLLVTDEFACAFCMCSVLTNVPLQTIPNNEMKPKCGSCDICRAVCPEGALTGTNWSKITQRDELVNVFSCTLCLKCLAHCPWTQAYVKKSMVLSSSR